MDKTAIRSNATKIWKLLSNNDRWPYEALKITTGLNDTELGAAIGWLACQNKIDFERSKNQLYFFLNVNVFIG